MVINLILKDSPIFFKFSAYYKRENLTIEFLLGSFLFI
nr:MAG TPA: hypothetical protein [Caudoviricetes sp.]